MGTKLAKLLFFSVCFLWLPSHAFATQAHGGSEGIIAHQIGHLFFMCAMCAFVYRSRNNKDLKESGWKDIKYFAVLLVLWNLDVIILHFLDEQLSIVSMEILNKSEIIVAATNHSSLLEIFYYIGKLDHLICVPALFFLFTGLKKLLLESETSATEKEKN
jgi:uncharacterized membrane-anchored protein